MRSRIVLMMMAVIAAVAGTACGSGSGSGATPTMPATSVAATPVSPPIAVGSSPTSVPTPAPALESTGLLVYLRGKNVYVGDLATGTEQQLTSGSFGAGYAGFARADGNIRLYYTSLAAVRDGPPGDRQQGAFDVYRRRLAGGDAELLFNFSAPAQDLVFAENASVSPDGRYVAFADTEGVAVHEVTTGAETRLLTTGHCEPGALARSACYSTFYGPKWSPKGDWLYASKGLYEGTTAVLVHDPIGSADVSFLDIGGSYAHWSSEGVLCMSDKGMQPFSTYLVMPGNPQVIDLTAQLPEASVNTGEPEVAAFGCTWGEDGNVEIPYSTIPNTRRRWVALFSREGTYIGRVSLGDGSVNYEGVVALPSGKGLVVTSTTYNPARVLRGVLFPDGTYRSLPFDVERVLGTISVP